MSDWIEKNGNWSIVCGEKGTLNCWRNSIGQGLEFQSAEFSKSIRLFGLPQIVQGNVSEAYSRNGCLYYQSVGSPGQPYSVECRCDLQPDWLQESKLTCAVDWELSVSTSCLGIEPIDLVSVILPNGHSIKPLVTLGTDKNSPIVSASQCDNGQIVDFENQLAMLAVDANDFSTRDIERGDDCLTFHFHLQSSRMEKGVIRRYRMCFAIAHRDDESELRNVFRAFDRSMIPLGS
ncbi:MAG: hypothetical protein R3C03_03685 [Pirellulaceae bacterium]